MHNVYRLQLRRRSSCLSQNFSAPSRPRPKCRQKIVSKIVQLLKAQSHHVRNLPLPMDPCSESGRINSGKSQSALYFDNDRVPWLAGFVFTVQTGQVTQFEARLRHFTHMSMWHYYKRSSFCPRYNRLEGDLEFPSRCSSLFLLYTWSVSSFQVDLRLDSEQTHEPQTLVYHPRVFFSFCFGSLYALLKEATVLIDGYGFGLGFLKRYCIQL